MARSWVQLKHIDLHGDTHVQQSISDVHETTSLIGRLLNTRATSATKPHLASILELPPTTLVLKKIPLFNSWLRISWPLSMDSMPLASLKSKNKCYRIQRYSLKLRTSFDKGHKNMCCTMYYSAFLQFFMQLDNIIWHSTSHITHVKGLGWLLILISQLRQSTLTLIPVSKVHKNNLHLSNMHTKSTNFRNPCNLTESLSMNSNKRRTHCENL